MEDLEPLLPEKVQEFLSSGDAFLQDLEPLSSILEKIPVTGDVLQAIEGTITTIAEVRTHFITSQLL